MAALYPVLVSFVPLVDAALLVIAREEGFAAAEGLDLILVREASWAAVRDRLAVGHVDAAHMLAPAAIAMHLGLGQPQTPLFAPMALNRDGNAITVSLALAQALQSRLPDSASGVTPRQSAAALASIIAELRRTGQPPLTVGTVFGYSCHTYQLGRWLGEAGLELERDVRLAIIPPPQMVEALQEGRIDLFCAGSPWNSLAVAAGVGRILHPCARIAPDTLEKLLVMQADRASAPWCEHLVRAIRKAAAFAAFPENRPRIAGLMAGPAYLGVPATLVEAVLNGTTATLFPSDPIRWVGLDPAATMLTAGHFAPILHLMTRAGHLQDEATGQTGIASMIAAAADTALA